MSSRISSNGYRSMSQRDPTYYTTLPAGATGGIADPFGGSVSMPVPWHARSGTARQPPSPASGAGGVIRDPFGGPVGGTASIPAQAPRPARPCRVRRLTPEGVVLSETIVPAAAAAAAGSQQLTGGAADLGSGGRVRSPLKLSPAAAAAAAGGAVGAASPTQPADKMLREFLRLSGRGSGELSAMPMSPRGGRKDAVKGQETPKAPLSGSLEISETGNGTGTKSDSETGTGMA